MTFQRVLLRLATLPYGRVTWQRLLRRRVWVVEDGVGAGLRLKLPQNLEYVTGASELPVQREIARRLAPGSVFYDIGANVGFFSIIAGRLVGQKGLVCAFEPYPPNAAMARENAALNGLANFRLFEVAAGTNSRKDDLLVTHWDGGAALSTSAARPPTITQTTTVQVVALDDFIEAERLPLPDFVKIDVEGVEMEVLQGMSRTLTRCGPVLLYEVDDGDADRFRRRWAELDEWVSQFGYDICHLENSYPGLKWNVGHSVAVPSAGVARSTDHSSALLQ
jgi:FkbM family methyltransferase